jgi:uncharacterized DUF497 family protein
VKIEFDPAKDAINREKHGISLADAVEMDWSNALVWNDTRRDYGEPRQVALAPLGDRLYCVAFVDRGKVRRIISLRKANQREFNRYEAEIDPSD